MFRARARIGGQAGCALGPGRRLGWVAQLPDGWAVRWPKGPAEGRCDGGSARRRGIGAAARLDVFAMRGLHAS